MFFLFSRAWSRFKISFQLSRIPVYVFECHAHEEYVHVVYFFCFALFSAMPRASEAILSRIVRESDTRSFHTRAKRRSVAPKEDAARNRFEATRHRHSTIKQTSKRFRCELPTRTIFSRDAVRKVVRSRVLLQLAAAPREPPMCMCMCTHACL